MSQLWSGLGRLVGSFAHSLPRLTSKLSAVQDYAVVKPYGNPLTRAGMWSSWVASPVWRTMATLNQMHRSGPHRPKPRKKGPMDGRPQLRGVVLKTLVKKPKKPNSANRKCVRLRLSTGKEVTAYVPGEGHNLQEHSIVLVRGGRVPDLPGVKLKCIRGKYDLAHVKK
ncbi:small ribosomal subunit protein uS12m-like [Babylonia areolata]|uniref:small ribosomal subunit protein uS12m-like n=1 Tax=Babylonia areolata TaxID=304850 RepID=UPI003FD24AB9